MENVTILAALWGGIASFLCPCHLPALPVFIASLAGPELAAGESAKRRFPIFLHSLFFVLGLGSFLTLILVMASLASGYLDAHAALIYISSCGLLIMLGFYMILAVKFPRINYECHLPSWAGMKAGYLRSFFIGAVYSVVHTPCITPILLAIATLVLNSGNPWNASGLMFVYFIGYGLPFLIAGIALGTLMPFFKKIAEYRDIIYISSGLLLIGSGIITLIKWL